MVLNYVWMFFFFCGVVVAIARSAMEGNVEIFNTLSEGMFTAAKDAVMSVGLPLAGTMIFFLGLMKVAEKAGAVQALSRLLNPFLKRLFPEIPERHPAMGEMVMNFSANMLGLDNAATPFGLKAMKSLEELNPQKGTASNSQIMFLVMHTSGLTLIPLSIIALRLSCTIPSKEPAAIFVPCVLATVIATLCSILIVGLRQRIRFDKVLGGWILTLLLTVGLLLFGIEHLNPETRQTFSKVSGNIVLLILVCSILAAGLYKKLNVFDHFIEGAKEGFDVVLKILPYLVAMLVAIRIFRDSGSLDMLVQLLKSAIALTGSDTAFTDALPVAIMKPFSGSGARGLLVDIYNNPQLGPDSFAGKMASIFQGSADTTFYIIALYFGSVQIKNVRYAIWAGLLADLLGVLAAILIGYIFFH